MTVININNISGIASVNAQSDSLELFTNGGASLLDINANLATFPGSISVAGTVTYDDVTNVDSIGIVTARSGVRVTGVGASVGIGTDNPAEYLNIFASSDTDAAIQLQTTTLDVNKARISKESTGELVIRSSNGSAGRAIVFETKASGQTERMRIKANGNVGIGTDDPTGTNALTDNTSTLAVGIATVGALHVNGNAYPSSGALSNRNLIVNGAMRISQRSTSLTGETGGGYKCLDRFRIGIVNLGTWTYTQSTDAPAGFSRSFKCECTTADASPAAGDLFNIQHRMEGQELQRLKKGTSSAESFTVSFWVKSNKTGTYNLQAEDLDNSRNNVRQYSVESANTWEYKTLTFDGDTTGALDNDNEHSFRLLWWLGSGTNYSSGTTPSTWVAANGADVAVGNVNLADSTSNVFYITGVQMETGSVTTPFEHLTYNDDLARCQRYYQEIIAGRVNTTTSGMADASGRVVVTLPLHVTPRINVAHDVNGTLTQVGDITVNAFPCLLYTSDAADE